MAEGVQKKTQRVRKFLEDDADVPTSQTLVPKPTPPSVVDRRPAFVATKKKADSPKKAPRQRPPPGYPAEPAGRGPQSRNWVFTHFGDGFSLDTVIASSNGGVTFCCGQKERCPKTQRLHFQGYLQCAKQQRGSWIRNILGAGAYCRAAVGDDVSNVAYTTKEDTRVEGPWSYGERKAAAAGPGARSDLLGVKRLLDAGTSLVDVARADDSFAPVIRSLRSLQWYENHTAPARSVHTIALVFWGSTGTGKSTLAHRLAPYLGQRSYQLAQQKGSGLYWDGYRPGDVVIIDEMDGSRCTPKFFNELCDQFPMQIPVHGGQCQFNSRYVIFTSNIHPARWWPNANTPGAVQRRMMIFPAFTKQDKVQFRRLLKRTPGVSPFLRL